MTAETSLPAAKAARLLGELAAEEGVEVPVAGTCMAPLVIAGQKVRLAPARFYWPGDLIAFRSAGGRLLLHRLIGWRPSTTGWRLLTQADNAARPDTAIARAEVIGRLVEREGEAVCVPLGDRWRALGRFLQFVGAKLLKTKATAGCARG